MDGAMPLTTLRFRSPEMFVSTTSTGAGSMSTAFGLRSKVTSYPGRPSLKLTQAMLRGPQKAELPAAADAADNLVADLVGDGLRVGDPHDVDLLDDEVAPAGAAAGRAASGGRGRRGGRLSLRHDADVLGLAALAGQEHGRRRDDAGEAGRGLLGPEGARDSPQHAATGEAGAPGERHHDFVLGDDLHQVRDDRLGQALEVLLQRVEGVLALDGHLAHGVAEGRADALRGGNPDLLVVLRESRLQAEHGARVGGRLVVI